VTPLTSREIQVLCRVAHGLPNKLIANELWVTEQTVKFHLTNVYRKLELPNRIAAARWAFDQGMHLTECT
jgi:DNA-binding NarL/FixJ family response regulator